MLSPLKLSEIGYLPGITKEHSQFLGINRFLWLNGTPHFLQLVSILFLFVAERA